MSPLPVASLAFENCSSSPLEENSADVDILRFGDCASVDVSCVCSEVVVSSVSFVICDSYVSRVKTVRLCVSGVSGLGVLLVLEGVVAIVLMSGVRSSVCNGDI